MKVKLVRNYFYLTDLMREEVIHRGERPRAPTAACGLEACTRPPTGSEAPTAAFCP